MEDEDGESKIIDMWNILEEPQLKDSTLSNTLRHSIDDVYANVIEEEKQLITYNSIVRKESSGKNTVAGSKLAFKGFKKRILAQAREVHTAALRNSAPESQQSTHPNARGGRDRRTDRKRERKIAEYARNLGLQPSARNRCSKCHAWSNCDPNLKQQSSCTCNSSMTPMPSTSESSASLSHASNFKRKVYLCSACNMYYENWNMFLHMREIHKRHICLFCLGMFGHAERLLRHLVKKHNVPEIPFATAGDFHNSFKGSCYLVCCDCEKLFSETDDFFSHYCSSTLTQEAIDTGTSVCTICRQTGTHASTCNFALLSDTDRESYGTATPLTVADTTRADNASPATVPLPEKTNLGGKGLPRKGMKYARNRHGGNGVQKLNALTRKLDVKNRCNEIQPDCDHDVQKEIANSLARDTVTETIMEVSRYTGGDSFDENDENDEQAVNKDVYNNRDRGLDEKSPIQNYQLDRSEPYDSVTETIMEVSRYTGEEDRIERREDSTCTPDILASHHEKMDTEEEEEEEEEACDRSNIHPTRSSRAPSPVRWEAEEPADAKSNPTYESGIESGFRSYSSPQDAQSPSPVSRSLFSPQHESHVPKEEEHFKDNKKVEVKKEDKPNATAESQATFSAVASSDRSLVIKICNRNSQFSVATTITASRESEESNVEGSKEKISNGADKERNIGDDQANELNDSDSDSDKLAVVDSNPEEDEEDGEEGEEADEEDGCERDDARDGSRENREGNSDNFGTNIDVFAVAETTPSGDVGERFANSGTEGPQAESVVNDQAKNQTIGDDGIVLAGEDVPFIDLNVEGTLDSMDLEELLKRCIEAASPYCIYCNHARYIAINGKQLSLHMLAEHKFQPQHPAIIIHAEQFIARVKRSLEELESRYFNLDTYDSINGMYNVPSVLIYECFHCRFRSTVHKELYLHNRKMHQKTILKCIMCKSIFYSYSELICHLCPGVYSLNINLRYRCCLCSTTSLPSTFRLMVHLRKRHHACDVCLESTGNQQRLSNHVWKHKLHHLCYRCGMTYRNKVDITNHLFWKHGTESVLCRKCLQKKWPHIYHFCIPPTAFVCEECGSSFSRAVALKVHKRLHSGDSPYNCDECTERFISRKLLAKHQAAHREPEPEDVYVNVTDVVNDSSADKDEKSEKDTATTAIDSITATGIAVETAASKNVKEAVKRVVDVYDLPPLNLSSESDTDSEEEKVATVEKPEKERIDEDVAEKKNEIVEETVAAVVAADDDDVTMLANDIVEVERNEEEKKQEARIMDGIWDNFKTYAASLDVEESAKNIALKESVPETDAAYLRSIVLADHDYHVVYCNKEKSEDVATSKDDDGMEQRHADVKPERTPSPSSPNRNTDSDANKRKTKTPKKKKRSGSASSTSDSSSDSDSSSCSCGTNCSCSSSSSGSSSSSSSSSDSDSSMSESSPRKQSSGRKDRSKKEREVTRENKSQSVEPEDKPEITIENGPAVPEITIESPTPPPKLLLRESDLETEETETDEDFYDEHPQLLANQLAEKRNQLQLLTAVAPASTSTSTPASTSTSLPAIDQSSTPLNNGVLDAEMTEMIIIDQKPQQQKRKAKTKKRRKGERANKRGNATNATVESIKLNIPKAFYSQKNPGFASPTLHLNSRSSTPNLMPTAACNDFHSGGGASVTMEMQQQQAPLVAAATPVIGIPNTNVGGGSETENKRVSKRKRVPKRFYGDSSDDEPQDKQPMFSRWRKGETAPSTPVFTLPPPTATASPLSIPKPTVAPTKLSFGVKTITTAYNRQHAQMEQTVGQPATLPEALPIAAPASATESEDPAGSSSDSSESETEDTSSQPKPGHNAIPIIPAVNASAAERPVKIYCYCQSPYDEVSEMIACDGEDCRIEWFHFECVGIMVPPKGKWYCPDCRKKHGIVQNNDDNCD